jgi:hypothetical protein
MALLKPQNRDDLEDAELENSQISEAMPVHMNGFKDHPLSVILSVYKRYLADLSDSFWSVTSNEKKLFSPNAK